MSTPTQGPMGAAPKKANPLIWIFGILGGLVLIGGLVLVAGGMFLFKKAQDATANPALTAAKLMAAANPDVEILSSDDSTGTVTFKDRSSGKVITLNFDQIREGKLQFEEDGQKFSVNSSSNGINITASDGSTLQIGADASAKLPEWMPSYPGATAQGTFAAQGGSETGAMMSFTTKDPIDKVAKFYEDALKKSGLSTTVNLLNQEGRVAGGMITGESADKKRSAVVNITPGDDELTVAVTYSDKK